MISLQQARSLHLSAQGLLTTPTKVATRAALRRCIERMQLLQIDTIHVVARSPYLVLFSRLGDYPVQWLEQALAQGHLFESWAHEACFIPITDLALHRSYNQQARRHWGIARGEESHDQQRANLDALLAHIQNNGPVKSVCFERADGQSGGWWGWKDEKRWLSCREVALFTDTSAILSEKELYGFPGSFPKILAIPGFGSLVLVQVVEFQKSHCHAAGTQEERRNAYRR